MSPAEVLRLSAEYLDRHGIESPERSAEILMSHVLGVGRAQIYARREPLTPQQARMLGRVAKLPRRGGFACPSCHQPPPLGPLWRCAKCFKPFDTFETGAVCPHCGAAFPVTQCLDCGEARPLSEWNVPPPIISSF